MAWKQELASVMLAGVTPAGLILVDVTPPFDRQLLRCELTALALLFWPKEEADNAATVAVWRSDGRPGTHDTTSGDRRGLWQLDVSVPELAGLAQWNLFDPVVNAYHAARLWSKEGWAAWPGVLERLGGA